MPQLLPEQPEPLTLQLTALFEVPVTLTWNCCCVPRATIAVVGETVTTTGAMMVTVAEAEALISATDVAVTTTLEGMELGAV
jgi:hypothetical protein